MSLADHDRAVKIQDSRSITVLAFRGLLRENGTSAHEGRAKEVEGGHRPVDARYVGCS